MRNAMSEKKILIGGHAPQGRQLNLLRYTQPCSAAAVFWPYVKTAVKGRAWRCKRSSKDVGGATIDCSAVDPAASPRHARTTEARGSRTLKVQLLQQTGRDYIHGSQQARAVARCRHANLQRLTTGRALYFQSDGQRSCCERGQNMRCTGA